MNSPQCFDFHCAQYLSGANNIMLRQEIARQLTGQLPPAKASGIYAIADVMKNSFSQYSLNFNC